METIPDFYRGLPGVFYIGDFDNHGVWIIQAEDRDIEIQEDRYDAETSKSLAFEVSEYYEECRDDNCLALFWQWIREIDL